MQATILSLKDSEEMEEFEIWRCGVFVDTLAVSTASQGASADTQAVSTARALKRWWVKKLYIDSLASWRTQEDPWHNTGNCFLLPAKGKRTCITAFLTQNESPDSMSISQKIFTLSISCQWTYLSHSIAWTGSGMLTLAMRQRPQSNGKIAIH